jgi:hypothetical protein
MRLTTKLMQALVAIAAAAVVATPLVIRAQGRDSGITVYESSDFRGRNITIDRDVSDLRAFGFAGQISSFRFRAGDNWEVCTGRNFTGRCRVFSESIADLRRSDWNDEIMSIRRARGDRRNDQRGEQRPTLGLVPGGSLELYAGTDYSGRRIVLTGPAPDFRRFQFNDRALSLRAVRGEAWEVCYNINYDDCRVVDGEIPNLARFNLEGISSAKPRPRGWQLRPANSIELYSGVDFSGESLAVRGSITDLSRDHFNDRAESLRVPRGQQWEVCVDAKFNNCRVVDHDLRDLNAEGLNRNISSVRPHGGR